MALLSLLRVWLFGDSFPFWQHSERGPNHQIANRYLGVFSFAADTGKRGQDSVAPPGLSERELRPVVAARWENANL